MLTRINHKDQTVRGYDGRTKTLEQELPEGYDAEDVVANLEALMEEAEEGLSAEEAAAWIEEYLENTDPDTGEDDEEGDAGGVVPQKYKQKYGSDQNCGDDIALALTAHVKSTDDKGKTRVDRAALTKVQKDHGIDGTRYEHLNPGMQVMNTSNRLRGLYNHGETITIGGVKIKHPQADQIKAEAVQKAEKSKKEKKPAKKKA